MGFGNQSTTASTVFTGSFTWAPSAVVENSKIACAKKLFNEMSTEGVRYHHVATYDELLGLISNME